jgi:hypothetical protein
MIKLTLIIDLLIKFCIFITAQPVVVTPKPVANLKEAPRRSLNLEDYKKKRGLI